MEIQLTLDSEGVEEGFFTPYYHRAKLIIQKNRKAKIDHHYTCQFEQASKIRVGSILILQVLGKPNGSMTPTFLILWSEQD